MTDQTNAAEPLKLDPIERAIEEIAAGRMVVVVDDEDRENEGDLIMAAECVTPEQVAFMIRHTSGILCAPLEGAEARRLGLSPMVAENDAPLSTAFTVSVDYRHGLTTGISADERCATIRGLANPNAGRSDFVRPGHIFPLIARDGGVLFRTGHTEAGVDLSRLAGLRPVSLLAELVNDDGTVKKGRQLEEFAREHGLVMVSIDALIAYRQASETLINRVDKRDAATAYGPARVVVYSSIYDDAQHIALVFGDLEKTAAPLVRLQTEDALNDVFAPREGRSLDRAMKRIAKEEAGVFIYLRHGAAGVARTATDFGDEGADEGGGAGFGEGAASDADRKENWRDLGLGAQIMRDLGLERCRVLASRERQYVGLSGFGLELVDTELL